VFAGKKVVVFCDGDFWHGRDLERRLAKLDRGTNAHYWTAKIARNAERDREQTRALEDAGWLVLRYWETDVLRRPEAVADEVLHAVKGRRHRRHESPISSSLASSASGAEELLLDSN
jgi:DNA mismatch endonuclease (patch repair protein)